MTRQVEVIGHRGARGLFPENTVEGFQSALALGVRSFELDAGVTADGVVVVHHDLALNPDITRDAAGAWLTGRGPLIHHLTWDALRTYDLGRIKWATPYRMHHRAQRGCDGARIAALEDVLRLSPDARFIIELKTDPAHPDWSADPVTMAEAVLSVVDRTESANRVVLESFDWRGPRHVRRVRPDIPLAWLTRTETEGALWRDGETAARYGGSVPASVAAQDLRGGTVWAPAWETLTKALVTEAHDFGLRVIPWTVNRRAAMRRLIAWNVDGLITDRPDIAMEETGQSVETK
jgi:glycerophosphoryl diester phosphodiesterase